jgi:hypothetical protein
VIYTQLGPTPSGLSNYAQWAWFVDKQSGLRMNKLAMVSARDLPVQSDQIHLTTAGLVTLGGRYASAMNALL